MNLQKYQFENNVRKTVKFHVKKKKKIETLENIQFNKRTRRT